jgi:hypothetical protein
MNDSKDHRADSQPRRHTEYEDPHFHDDIDAVPADDGENPRPRSVKQRNLLPRLLRRRHYED